MKMLPIKAGELFLITRGEYSDFGVEAVARATKDFEPDKLIEEWLQFHGEQRELYMFKEHDFMAWVYAKDLFETIDVKRWHLGDNHSAKDVWSDTFDNAEWKS